MRYIAVLLVLGSMLGCLTEETTNRVYLDPDGSVTVGFLQTDIRSDGKTPQARLMETSEFLMKARANAHPAAELLLELGAHSIQTTILREERPYAVYTEGRLASIEMLIREILADESDGRALIGFEIVESEAGLTVSCDRQPYSEDSPTGCDALRDAFTDTPLILTDGQFIRATGFGINDSGTHATMLPDEALELYSLVWEVDPVNQDPTTGYR
jgi:hypothetical protein